MLTGFEKFPEEQPSDIAVVRYKNGPKYDKEYFDAFYEILTLFFIKFTRREHCEKEYIGRVGMQHYFRAGVVEVQ